MPRPLGGGAVLSVAVSSVGVLRCVGTIGLNAADLLSNVRLLGATRTWRVFPLVDIRHSFADASSDNAASENLS